MASPLDGESTIDHIVLREDIKFGERIRKFSVEGQRADGTWSVLVRGTQVGCRQIFPIQPVSVKQLRLTVQESAGQVTLREFAVYKVNRSVPKVAFRDVGGTGK